jgi:hypothetical protein
VARRYLRGARAASRVDHPGIVRTYGCGLHDGCPYTVMELIDGSDLMDLLDSYGPFPVRATLEVAEAVAQACGAAFEQVGLIHRDIKPDNIMVTREGVVKVADLDLAKVVGDRDTDAFAGLTAAGSAMGTPYYMSPEQCIDSSTVDHRSDMFSLGATLYQLLTGEHPFRGKTLYTVMRNVVENDPQPLPERIPAPVRGLVTKMLAKNPDERHQTYEECLLAIRAAKSRVGSDGDADREPEGREPGRVKLGERAPGTAPSLPGQAGDRFLTLPFLQAAPSCPDGGLPPSPYSPEEDLLKEPVRELLKKGSALLAELHRAAREFIASGPGGSEPGRFPSELRTRLGREPDVVQAAIEVVSPGTGLYETAAKAVNREIGDIREVRRDKRRPSSAKEIQVRPGTAIIDGAPHPVRVFRQAVADSEGRAGGRVVLVMLDPSRLDDVVDPTRP